MCARRRSLSLSKNHVASLNQCLYCVHGLGDFFKSSCYDWQWDGCFYQNALYLYTDSKYNIIGLILDGEYESCEALLDDYYGLT